MKKSTILVVAVILLSVMMFSGCSDLILKNKLLEKYSDDQNYVALSGKIVEVDGLVVVIQCEELSEYLSYEDDLCEYYIHSKQILDLKVGDEIQFITVPFHFYNGHQLPIVELKTSESTLLEFADGKDNLIDWVNDTFDVK
ncbi:MAG: hypothetical protein IJY13_03420 [Clostridia bacterium]|nr:hypothetical protein [Clostridia bacterium]